MIPLNELIHNYNQFCKNNNPEYLKRNIDLFADVDMKQLHFALKSIIVENLAPTFEALLIMGKTYSYYNLVMQQKISSKDIFNYFRMAIEYFDLIEKTIHLIPPFVKSKALDNYRLEAVYWMKLAQFYNAEALFDYGSKNSTELAAIFKTCQEFFNLLKGSYKDRTIQEKLGIETVPLAIRINTLLTKVSGLQGQLLEKINGRRSKRKTPIPLAVEGDVQINDIVKVSKRQEEQTESKKTELSLPIELSTTPLPMKKMLLLRFFQEHSKDVTDLKTMTTANPGFNIGPV